MKFTATLFLFAIGTLSLFAQNKVIHFELGGPSNGINLSYDARLKPNSPWGYRVGLGYSGEISSGMGSSYQKHNVTVHLEGNHLWSKGNHHLEAGVGVSLGRYSVSAKSEHTFLNSSTTYNLKAATFGYFFYGTAGYRYQRPRGIMFRAGVHPTLNPGGDHGVGHSRFLMPYVGIGYSF